MWSGRIVPLFKRLHEVSRAYKHLTAQRNTEPMSYDPANSSSTIEPEEMLLPLPEDICFGTGIRDGSVVHVAYQWNPPIVCNNKGEPNFPEHTDKEHMAHFTDESNTWLEHYGPDIAAWIVVSPFPIELLPDRIMQLIVRLGNEPGAFFEAVATPATICSAAMLQVEGLSTGDEGSVLLFPATVEKSQSNPASKTSTAGQGSTESNADSDKMWKLIAKLGDEVGSKLLTEFSAHIPATVIEKWGRKEEVSDTEIEESIKNKRDVLRQAFRQEYQESVKFWKDNLGIFKDLDEKIDSEVREDITKKLKYAKVRKTLEKDHNAKSVVEIGWLEELVEPELRYKRASKKDCHNTLWKMQSRKISVRDRMIMIPWGDIARRYRDARWWIKDKTKRNNSENERQREFEDNYDILQPLPRYALLVRDPDLPVVIGVIPQRMLFQVIMQLRSSGVLTAQDENIAVGSIAAVCGVLKNSGSNIWHIEQLPSQITFTERARNDPKALECSFIESELKIVAACPPEWRYADVKSMQEYFRRLKHNLAQLKLPRLRVGEKLHLSMPSDASLQSELQRIIWRVNKRILLRNPGVTKRAVTIKNKEIVALDTIVEAEVEKEAQEKYIGRLASILGLPKKEIEIKDFLIWSSGSSIDVNNLIKLWPDINEVLWETRDILNKSSNENGKGAFDKCETWLRETINEFGEPLVVSKDDIEIHAPPLLRIFFSHSAHPDPNEKDHIYQIKEILKNYSESIVEGQFSAGLSTEELSRDRIRLCTALVSFFWPRDEYINKEGTHVPPEWVAHEESFAMGLGLRVIRLSESSVRKPRYEYDRPTIEFTRGDSSSWQKSKEKLEKELCEFVLVEAQKFLRR